MLGLKKNVLIAAGGTGGHIYPALSIAQVLQSQGVYVCFVGTARGLENKIVPQEGYHLEHIPIGRLNRNISWQERISTLLLLPFAFIKSIFLLAKYRPSFVLGMGGHASGPMLFMAALLRVKTFIWEPNAYPGLANRLLSRFVNECLVVFDEAAQLLKTQRFSRVGMPLRAPIEALAQETYRPSSEGLNVLVFGGSQGARAINDVVSAMLQKYGARIPGLRMVHQTGALDIERIQKFYQQHPCPVEVYEYLHDMDKRYQWADVVIARAGTGTLSELAAAGRGAILIPLPWAADNHQQKNAEVLEKAGAAAMVLQKDLSPENLYTLLLELSRDKMRLQKMSEQVRQFYIPQAAQAIGKYLLQITEGNEKG